MTIKIRGVEFDVDLVRTWSEQSPVLLALLALDNPTIDQILLNSYPAEHPAYAVLDKVLGAYRR